jgi:hypothetical protein
MTLPERLIARATWYSRIGIGRARRATRLALSGAGFPIATHFLTMDCADDEDASGLFSEVAAIVGCLAEVTAYPALYAGMRVDFQDHGLYYDAERGPNWWNYFFEPLVIGSPEASTMLTVPDWQHDAFAEAVELDMPRVRAADLVRQHVRVRPALLDEVDRYWRAKAAGTFVVGVHYRGTDKWEGRTPIAYDAVANAIRAVFPSSTNAAWKIFLATDEQACVDYFSGAWPGRVLFREMRRSSDGRPIHKTGNGFQQGTDAMLDCLLLARCAHLVRTDSDLGLFATFFNPDLPVIMLETRT